MYQSNTQTSNIINIITCLQWIQSINQHELAMAPHIQSFVAPEIQCKYKNITVSQLNTHYRIVSYGNDSAKRWVLSLLRKSV